MLSPRENPPVTTSGAVRVHREVSSVVTLPAQALIYCQAFLSPPVTTGEL